jgi:DoxX-like family
MKTLFVICSLLLALVAAASATMDFRGAPQVRELMHRLQYRPGFERFLGLIKVLGALGLVVGLFVHGLGLAAAIGFVLYFALAVKAHVNLGDAPSAYLPAAVLLALSALTLVAGLAS